MEGIAAEQADSGKVADPTTESGTMERESRELLTIEEVARYLKVPPLTVRWLRQEGRFAPAIKVGRRLLWDRRDVNAWLDGQRETEAA